VISKTDWQAEYNQEIEHALLARSARNEGMARVCARRAAGIVIGEYLIRQGFSGLNNSAYDRLTLFASLEDVDEKCKEIAGHFLLKVDQDHQLGENIDLIQDIIWLKGKLLSNNKA
jgi:hypothetical protein